MFIPENTSPSSPRTLLYLRSFLFWCGWAVLIGGSVGGAAVVFAKALRLAASLRHSTPFLRYLLPLAGCVIVAVYHLAQHQNPRGTNLVIEAVRNEARIPPLMAPLIFLSTFLSHLCGASVGREGAALQLGGSMGQWIGDRCHLDEKWRHISVMCGMSAAFSAIFGAPIAAAVFSLELASIGMLYYSAIVPCTIASLTAHSIALACGVPLERFSLLSLDFSVGIGLRVLLLAGGAAAVGILLCVSLHKATHLFSQWFPNPYSRIIVGGGLVILLTLLVGNNDYLGPGMEMVERALEGEVIWFAFLLKILFTSISIGAGYKGGEIVPALFIGATFGGLCGSLLGLPAGFGAGMGMIALFCAVTNCPTTSLLLGFELFSFSSPTYLLMVVAVSYMLSGCYSLYSTQRILFSKIEPKILERMAH